MQEYDLIVTFWLIYWLPGSAPAAQGLSSFFSRCHKSVFLISPTSPPPYAQRLQPCCPEWLKRRQIFGILRRKAKRLAFYTGFALLIISLAAAASLSKTVSSTEGFNLPLCSPAESAPPPGAFPGYFNRGALGKKWPQNKTPPPPLPLQEGWIIRLKF